MAENTARRGIYLPIELDQWFVDQAEKTGVKINQLMLDALNEYKEKQSMSNKKKSAQFESKIFDLIRKYNIKAGIQGSGADK